ncbi:ubiquinol-cytochrome-c reductase complex subunit 6 [Kockovaella imperatae]|uniref:Complex III subunit 7 n=1 Tax=Kockovaella imperatae TaxID=4999 RepID=A0A1Y1UNR5_9TREE|nr:ubiquinol-cytochrome-c reductase complex subunit 6 [Kockovaella imperatae]ORX39144.1 ubiquinol-cytochrome-c reductase complex subunit 6 [Kockovaella imperatae]
MVAKVPGGPLGISFAPWLKANMPGLYGRLKPVANWYCHIAGWRQMGLKYDDLLLEEREDVQKALTRLTPRESYDRVYRMRRAHQQAILHKELPKNEWITPEEDRRYLSPHIQSVVRENKERAEWDSVKVEKLKSKK